MRINPPHLVHEGHLPFFELVQLLHPVVEQRRVLPAPPASPLEAAPLLQPRAARLGLLQLRDYSPHLFRQGQERQHGHSPATATTHERQRGDCQMGGRKSRACLSLSPGFESTFCRCGLRCCVAHSSGEGAPCTSVVCRATRPAATTQRRKRHPHPHPHPHTAEHNHAFNNGCGLQHST